MQMPDTAAMIDGWRERFEALLPMYLPNPDETPDLLYQAMRYSATSGGKRIRPMFVYAAGRALGIGLPQLDAVAIAIEFIHCYSLIHDDLPCMDDDDLRRGKPSCHCRFDEATAILAGDALQALSFGILAADASLSSHAGRQATIIGGLAKACGAGGMAGGQVLDLASVGGQLSQAELENIHAFKTGALIRICTTAPAILAAAGESERTALEHYGRLTGLAFQVFDDLLDVTGDSETIGKPSQADAARAKPTFPSVIGVPASYRRAYQLRDEALAELAALPGPTDALAWLAGYAVDRKR